MCCVHIWQNTATIVFFSGGPGQESGTWHKKNTERETCCKKYGFGTPHRKNKVGQIFDPHVGGLCCGALWITFSWMHNNWHVYQGYDYQKHIPWIQNLQWYNDSTYEHMDGDMCFWREFFMSTLGQHNYLRWTKPCIFDNSSCWNWQSESHFQPYPSVSRLVANEENQQKKNRSPPLNFSPAKWQSCIKTSRSAAWFLSIKVRAILDGKGPWMTHETPTRLRTTLQKKQKKCLMLKNHEKSTGHEYWASWWSNFWKTNQNLLHVLLKNQYRKAMLPEPAKIGTSYPGKITVFRRQKIVGFWPKKLTANNTKAPVTVRSHLLYSILSGAEVARPWNWRMYRFNVLRNWWEKTWASIAMWQVII